jgi:N12 class adenine-specific DNA methylase
VERDQQKVKARQEQMVKELRKAELVRDRLEGLKQIAEEYPEGHVHRSLIETLELDRALGVVEEDIQTLRDTLIHPRGT